MTVVQFVPTCIEYSFITTIPSCSCLTSVKHFDKSLKNVLDLNPSAFTFRWTQESNLGKLEVFNLEKKVIYKLEYKNCTKNQLNYINKKVEKILKKNISAIDIEKLKEKSCSIL